MAFADRQRAGFKKREIKQTRVDRSSNGKTLMAGKLQTLEHKVISEAKDGQINVDSAMDVPASHTNERISNRGIRDRT